MNAAFAAGVLDIAIQDNGGNVDAALLSDDGVHFFVDGDGDQLYDDGTTDPMELRGLLSELTRVNVVGDSGVGTFLWRDQFSAAMLSAGGASAVDIADVASVNLAAEANITGDVTVSAEQSVQFGGTLTIDGNLTVNTVSPTGTVSGSEDGSLEVTGNAQLTSHNISLGAAAGDHFAVGSLTMKATGDVTIAEDGSAADPDTLLSGINTAATLTLSSDGSITLASDAGLTVDDGLQLNATGTLNSIRVDGLIESAAGDITLHAGEQIVLGSGASITSDGSGAIALTADGSGIAMADGSQLGTLDGAIHLTALDADGGNISLGLLTTGNGPGAAVQIMAAGNITDGTAGEDVNILSSTGSLWLQSLGGSIGTAADDLNVDVQDLAFDAGAATLGVVHISDAAGGLRISGASRAAGGATITASSPLTISANIDLGASSTFTAGNSGAAGDNLTVENSAVVTLTSLLPATLTFNAGDDILFLDAGRVVTAGNDSHVVALNADLDHTGLGAADGDRGAILQDGTPAVEVATNRLIARAAEAIQLDTQIDSLDALSAVSGDVVITEVDSITLENVETAGGSIDVRAGDDMFALNVRAGGGGSNVDLRTVGNFNSAALSGLVIASREVRIEATTGNIFSGQVQADDGSATLLSSAGDVQVSYVSASDNLTIEALAGSINDQEDDSLVDLAAGGTITLTARDEISGPGADNRLELAAGSELTASSVSGNIQLRGLGGVTLTDVRTGNGTIDVLADGTVAAVYVDSSGTDSDDNDVRMATSSGDIVVTYIRAGLYHGDVVADAQADILDGDSGPDDVDIEGNGVTLISQAGDIGVPAGSFFIDRPNTIEVSTYADAAFPLEPGDLSATALSGSIALDVSLAGSASFSTNTVFLTSSGDLNVSTANFAVTNLAMIADADGDGFGTLTLGPTLSVGGDLRLEGADVVSQGPMAPLLDLAASRLLFRSLAQADIQAAVQILDVSTQGDLSLRTTLAAVQLVDLNGDNVALQTTDFGGSIVLEASGTITVTDDVLVGNDGLTTSSGGIEFRFAVGAMGDILIHDSLLTDLGDTSLTAPGSIRLENPAIADPLDDAGADNLPVIATIAGNVALFADSDGDGGEIFMADTTRIIAGREAVNYVPGSGGLPSSSTLNLGGVVKGPGQAQIELTATDSITLGSLQTTNNSSAAVRIISTAGAISDGGDTDVDIIANQAGALATLSASSGIGSIDAIETAVDRIDVRNLGLAGNIGIHEVAAGGQLRAEAAVNAASGGSILLAVDAGSLQVAGVGVAAVDGNVTLLAGNDVHVQASIFSSGTGDIYLSAGNVVDDTSLPQVDGITIDADVSTDAGSILLQSQQDLKVTADISSNLGAIGLTATGNILLAASIATTADVLVSADADTVMDLSASIAGNHIVLSAGGSLGVAEVSGNRVALKSSGDITDTNAAAMNIVATTLHIAAGGSIGQADAANGSADDNSNALDISVASVAARSGAGIYLQQQGDLLVGSVTDLLVSVTVEKVGADSSITTATVQQDIGGEDGLSSSPGPIKVRVDSGDLSVGGSGVSASGGGDVLLLASGGLTANASIVSDTGHITLAAAGQIDVQASVATGGAGSLYLVGSSINVDGVVQNINGNLLLDAAVDLHINAAVASQNASVGLLAGRDVLQDASVTAGGDLFLQAGRDATQVAGAAQAGGTAHLIAGGSMSPNLVDAVRVLLQATGSIVDGNGDTVNVTASSFSARAGSLGTQADPLELRVETIAAETTAGIYVQQLAGPSSLTVGHVAMAQGEIVIQQVNFNSTLSPVVQTWQADQLSDLVTSRPEVGMQSAIEVHVLEGDLIITEGQTANERGVLVRESGSIGLRTSTAGDIVIQTGIETFGLGDAGRVTLQAAGNIREAANVSGGIVSDAQVIGDSLVISAGGFAHLHDVSVNRLSATVGDSGLLDGVWQQTNARANNKGDDFLDQLGSDRQANALAEGVITEIDRAASDSLESAIRASYQDIARQFRFEDTYLRDYALFLKNSKTLDVQQVVASDQLSPGGFGPTVYIETVEATADLIVSGSIESQSLTASEGGIILVAGGRLDLQGSLATSAQLNGLTRIQRIEAIGNLPTTDALGNAAVGYLNARTFDGGEGVTSGDLFLTSTQFVIRDQVSGLSATNENYRTHVFQRVVAQYGFAGEAGFVTFVGYADGEIQQFDVAGESGARFRNDDPTDPNDQSALIAVPRGSTTATPFSRATAFDPQFLDTNPVLPTSAVIRRAADFFLFENAVAAEADIRDLTVESFEVDNVFTFGSRGAINMPRDPLPAPPPALGLAVSPEILVNPTQLVRNDIELAAISERTIEVAIYRVYYDDLNSNGQAEDNELPSEEQILAAEVVIVPSVEEQPDEMPKGQRLKLETVKTASGGSPTAEDIEALKEQFLNDPERPSGAYSIIERGLDDEEEVLDVFSVKDREPADDTGGTPLVRPPTAEESQRQQQQRDAVDQTEVLPVPPADGAAHQPSKTDGAGEATWSSGRVESRFAHAGWIASSLWVARMHAQTQAVSAADSGRRENQLSDAAENTCDFSRRGRRLRRWQRRKFN